MVSGISSNLVNLTQSLSTIQDADLARAVTEKQSLDIKQEVSLNMLKDANEAPKQVLKLIGGNVDTYA